MTTRTRTWPEHATDRCKMCGVRTDDLEDGRFCVARCATQLRVAGRHCDLHGFTVDWATGFCSFCSHDETTLCVICLKPLQPATPPGDVNIARTVHVMGRPGSPAHNGCAMDWAHDAAVDAAIARETERFGEAPDAA